MLPLPTEKQSCLLIHKTLTAEYHSVGHGVPLVSLYGEVVDVFSVFGAVLLVTVEANVVSSTINLTFSQHFMCVDDKAKFKQRSLHQPCRTYAMRLTAFQSLDFLAVARPTPGLFFCSKLIKPLFTWFNLSRTSYPSGAPSGATVRNSAPSRSAPLETAAVKDAAAGKVDESRRRVAAGSGGVRSTGAASANADIGTALARSAGDEGVSTRVGADVGIDGSSAGTLGTLAMNSPASDKRFSSSSSSLLSALPPVQNTSLHDSRPNSVPKDKRSSRGVKVGEGARNTSGSSQSRHREGHAGGRRGEGGSSEGMGERKSRSGGGNGDPARSRRKDAREGEIGWAQIKVEGGVGMGGVVVNM